MASSPDTNTLVPGVPPVGETETVIGFALAGEIIRADARFEGRDPREDPWLMTLSKRRWHLEIAETDQIRLNPRIMNYVDDVRSYNFSEALAKRSDELRKSIQEYAQVIWPVIVRGEDFMLVDGYCRHTALKRMNIRRTYAYIGTLSCAPVHCMRA